MRIQLHGRLDLLFPVLGLLLLVGVLCLPFGLKRPDRMEGWVLMNDLERQESPISQNLDGTVRPLLLLSWFIVHKLDANSFAGAHILLMVLVFGKGFVLYKLLKRVFPGNTLLAFLSAVLFVSYPGDTGIVDIRILNIHSAVFLYLVAVYWLVATWQNQNRRVAIGLLLAAGIAVTMSLATYEIAYPLVICTPLLLLWLEKRFTRRLLLTSGVWYAGPLIYGLYWLHNSALARYQNQLLQAGLHVENNAAQMLAGLLHASVQGFWSGWANALALTDSSYLGLAGFAALLIVLLARRSPHNASSTSLNLRIATAGVVIFFLGFIPYLPTSLRTETWRVYLYASIGATLSLAALAQLVASFFPMRRAIFLGLISPLVALGILSALHQQELAGENSSAQEQILESLVQQAPHIHPGTLIVLLDDPAEMGAYRAFWTNFYFENAVQFMYADQTIHARICYPNLETWGDWADRCKLSDNQVVVSGGGWRSGVSQTYDQVLAFRYSPTGEAQLLWQIPSIYRPGQGSNVYDPRKVVDFSGSLPLRASTLFDSTPIRAEIANLKPIVDGQTIGLGASWYPPESNGSQTFQWVDNDAEFIIGMRQEPAAIIRLEVGPGPGLAYEPFRLNVLDANNRVVAVGSVQTQQDIELILLLNSGRANLFRLHVDGGGQPTPGDSRIMNFRIFNMTLLRTTTTY